MNPITGLKATFLMLFLGVASFVSFKAEAGDPPKFVGSITFSIKMNIPEENQAQMAGMIPTQYQMFIKGDKTAMVYKDGMMALMMPKLVIDAKTNESYIVNDAAKTVKTMETPPVDPTKDQAAVKKVVETSETMKIAGYLCKKYLITIVDDQNGQEMVMTMWITDQLGQVNYGKNASVASMSPWIKAGVKGMPLKMTFSQMGAPIEMEAIAVEKKEIPDSFFAKPAGYKVSKFDAGMFGGE
jgi:hypothetical protein